MKNKIQKSYNSNNVAVIPILFHHFSFIGCTFECCFQNASTSTTIELGYELCRYPYSFDFPPNARVELEGLIMVTKPKELPLKQFESEPIKTFNTFAEVSELYPTWNEDVRRRVCTADCDDIIRQWHGLYPVYSKTSGTIYINELCAYCNNDTDFVHSDPKLQCKYHFIENLYEAVEHTLRGEPPTPCSIVFNFPDYISNDGTKRCRPSVINSCLYDQFDIPEVIDMTHQQIVDVCENGFTFYVAAAKDQVFANPFCIICNQQISQTMQSCSGFDQFGFYPLSVILQNPGSRRIQQNDIATIACRQQYPVSYSVS